MAKSLINNNKLTPIPRPPDNYRPSYASAYAVENAAGGTLFTGAGSTKEPEKRWHWIDDDRIPSQAEIDWYAAQEAGEDPPEITQEHLDAIGMGEGGEGLTVDDVGKGDDPHWSDPTLGGGGYDNAPGTTDPKSEHNPYIDPVTGEKKHQTREEWSESIGDDAISVGPTDTTSNKDEDDLFYGGKGFSSRTKGANPYLKIKKKSKGAKGKFTRGSLRVKKPKRMAV